MRTKRMLTCLLLVWAISVPAFGQSGSGSLKITSYPSGASVWINGVDTGKTTPMSDSLTLGEHTITVAIPNSGWNPDTRTVTIVSGNNDLSVTLLPTLTVGPQGPPGPKGDTGPQGPAGASGQVFLQTVVVSPSGATANDNGLQLLAALDGITDNSASNGYLVVLEPGVYDVGSETLTLKPFIDLAGSGRNTTIVQGDSSSGVLLTDSKTEIRDLTLMHRGAACNTLTLKVSGTDVLLSRLSIVGGNTTNTATSCNTTGLSAASGATAILNDLTVTGGNGGFSSRAITFFSGSHGELMNVTATGGSATTLSLGVQNLSTGLVLARNSRFSGGTHSFVNNGGGKSILVSTQVDIAMDDPNFPGVLKCHGSYNSQYVALSSTCQ